MTCAAHPWALAQALSEPDHKTPARLTTLELTKSTRNLGIRATTKREQAHTLLTDRALKGGLEIIWPPPLKP